MSKLLVGLTGGIASGKTTVANFLAELGADIIDTDQIAREVVEPGEPALAAIEQHFGSSVISPDGALDRAQLRNLVFSDPGERKWLEALLHPLIRQRAAERVEHSEKAIRVLVVPLLFESGQYQQTDLNIVVDIPTEIQKQRVQARDAVSLEQTEKILAAQMAREERVARADLIVCNDGTLDELRQQVKALFELQLKPRIQAPQS